MAPGFNEDLSRDQIAQMEASIKSQNEAMAAQETAKKATAETGSEKSSKDTSGEKPGFLRRVLFRLNIGAEKYLKDMEAYVDKQWEQNKTELEKEVDGIVKDTEKHTDDTIVDLEYKIHNLVKAGELGPSIGDKLTAQLEGLRKKAKETAVEAVNTADAVLEPEISAQQPTPEVERATNIPENIGAKQQTTEATTINSETPTTKTEQPVAEDSSATEAKVETTSETPPTKVEKPLDLKARQTKILEGYKDNPHGRTEEEQDKYAWYELYTSNDCPIDVKQKVDALRKDWAVKDKSAGHPAELNQTGNDYAEGTDQWKLQTGEALRQIAEATPETAKIEEQKDVEADEFDDELGQQLRNDEASESDREEDEKTAEQPEAVVNEQTEEDTGEFDDELGKEMGGGDYLDGDRDEEPTAHTASEAEPVAVADPTKESGAVQPETKAESTKLSERLTKKEGMSVEQYTRQIEGAIQSGELTKANMDELRIHITKSFETPREVKQALQGVCESLVKNKQTELAKQFAYAEVNPIKRGDQFYAIASAMVDSGEASTPDDLGDALFQIAIPEQRGQILSKLDSKNSATEASTGGAANDNDGQSQAA